MGKNERIKIKLKDAKADVYQPSWKSVIIIFMVLVYRVLMRYGVFIFN